MGFFGIFKKKRPSHQEKLVLAYKCYKAEFIDLLFPGGIDQADKIVCSLAKVYGIDINACDARKYYSILNTYADVFLQRVAMGRDDDPIIKRLMVKHNDLIRDKMTAQKALAFATLNTEDNNFSLESLKDEAMLNFTAHISAEKEQTAKKNTLAEKENLNDPEYGLVPEKPIYTLGIAGSKKYLSELKTSFGESLNWERSGSIAVKNMGGVVDIYESVLPSGEAYKTLYINMYGTSNSTGIPKGFKR